MTLTHPHRWAPGSRFRLRHRDTELERDTTIAGVVLSVCELTDVATVAVDGVPIPTTIALECLDSEAA